MMIKEITAAETIPVRQEVLRQGKPVESCHFDGDALATTKHLGYFENGELIGIVSVYEKNSPAFAETFQLQMRGMAILEAYQKRGIGQELVRSVEKQYAMKKGGILWFNARVSAFEFYKKLGYQVLGEAFDIPDVGPHYLMFRRI